MLMFGLPIASIITLIPLVGMMFISITDKKNITGIKSVSFWTSLFVLCASIFVATSFDYSAETFTEEVFIFPNSPIKYRVGLDSISVLFVPMISLICLMAILWIAKRKSQKKKSYFMSILLFEALSIGAFFAWDIFLLFVLIESTIIPIYILMAQRKEQASGPIFYFLIYAMISAILILTALIAIYLETKTSNLTEIYQIGIKNKTVLWLLLLGIGIKMPIWPFYNWLPVAHVKSQTICSVFLASIVLKFSTLLILRLVDPIFMDYLIEYRQIVLFIIALSIVFATSQLIFQDDLKKVFAYFSIIHMNSAFPLLMSSPKNGRFVYYILYHSILMAVLFFASNVIHHTYDTRSISKLRNIKEHSSEIRVIAALAFLVLISIPFSWGFLSEFLMIQAVSKISIPYSILISSLIIISSLYAVYIYSFCFGYKKINNTIDSFPIDPYKKAAFTILFGVIFILGIMPSLILDCF